MEPINAFIKAIDIAIRETNLALAREYYRELTKVVGADSTREGFTHDLRRQKFALRRIEDAEAATRRR